MSRLETYRREANYPSAPSTRGIASTPGIVIDGKVVHAGGLPKPDELAHWLAP
ncbi:thioredoxin family protein [Bradyrhizobium sp. WYCCWR 12699]|nr:thioredoxin family protein [Bradyrhizobium sp. WYCCWR 12699]MDT4740669.1 thioredoxin family protein [Bradyrhizobium sp. WYCCWR 12699]